MESRVADATEEVMVGTDGVSMRSNRATLIGKSTAKDQWTGNGCPDGMDVSDGNFEGMSSAGHEAGNEVFY